MDWNKHETYQHLTPMQVQQKIDELNKETQTIPVLKKDMDLNSLYTIEVWFHFNTNVRIAMIYKEIIYED